MNFDFITVGAVPVRLVDHQTGMLHQYPRLGCLHQLQVIPTVCTWYCPHSTESYAEKTGSYTDFEGKRRKTISVGRKMKQNSKIHQIAGTSDWDAPQQPWAAHTPSRAETSSFSTSSFSTYPPSTLFFLCHPWHRNRKSLHLLHQ